MSKENGGRELFRSVKRGIQDVGFRAEQGMPRNPFSNLAGSLYRVGMHTAVTTDRRRESLRIALVSMPTCEYEIEPFSTLRSRQLPAGVDAETCARRLVRVKNSVSAAMLAAFKEAIRTAVETLKADIVCVSELGLPTRNLMISSEAVKYAYEASQKHEAVIVAGSGHDSRTLSNTGHLFYPGSPKTGQTFHKTISAVSTGEMVSAPAVRRILGVGFFGLGIAMMICLDIADYAALASVVKVGDAIDMVLVPCYTDKFEKMVDIATVASKALPGVVALVNANLVGSVAAPCHIAKFGALEKPSDVVALQSNALISVFELPQDEFVATRTRLKTAPENQMEWLFGSRDRPQLYS
jgi:hypothetical protein